MAPNVGTVLNVNSTPSEAISMVEYTLKSKWNEEFINISNCKGHFTKKKLTNIITGHTFDKKYLYRICPSIHHIIFECPRFINLKKKYDCLRNFDNVYDILKSKKFEVVYEIIIGNPFILLLS